MTELIPSGFVFHQSNLQTFLICRYRFFLRYVQKMPWPAAVAATSSQFEQDQAAGSYFHSLIHQHFLGIDRDTVCSCAQHFPDIRVRAWFDNFMNTPYAKIRPNLYPEHTNQIQLDGNLLLAKFDLIIFEGDTIQIFDWKTSRKLPKRQFLQSRIQTMVYPLVAARAQAKPPAAVNMLYWEAGFPGLTIQFNFTQDDLQTAQLTLASHMRTIRSLEPEQFEQTTDFQRCALCEYQSFCNRNSPSWNEDSYYEWKSEVLGLVD